MGSLRINYISALLSLLLFVSNCGADAEATTNLFNHLQNLGGSRSRTQHIFAHRFKTRFNLSNSRDGVNNIVQDDLLHNESAEKLVENPIRFPSLLSDSGSHNIAYLGHHAGYFKFSDINGHAGMFYFFFEARQNKATAPVIVWLSGGPGCSSSIALFNENGPFKVLKNLSLVWNNYGWDQAANIIYVDQPIGTGFSYYTDETDIPTISEEAAFYFYDFIQAFLKKHPMFSKNAFHLTGESYAGHYIPAFADQIIKGNNMNQHPLINLQTVAIGSGWTNSGAQTATYPDYAMNMKLINKSQYNKLRKPVKNCLKEVDIVCNNATYYNLTACAQTYIDCKVIFETITDLHPGLNPYDIRLNCTGPICYDFSRTEHFLNQISVKRALGVDVHKSFASCSDVVYNAMAGDEMRNLAVYIPELLENGIKFLLYGGEYDLICNLLGNSKWVHEMEWSGKKCFNAASYTPFIVDGAEVGSQKSYESLTFLKVYKAGHLVSMDQPKLTLEMMRRWMKGLNPL